MNSSELLEVGIELLFLGMGSVFAFLILLVIVTTLMSKIIVRYYPEPVAAPASKSTGSKAAPAAIDEQTIAVISAAISQHRARRRT